MFCFYLHQKYRWKNWRASCHCLKARHLRAASEDLSSSSTDRGGVDVTAAGSGRPAAPRNPVELGDRPPTERHARRSDPTDTDTAAGSRFSGGGGEPISRFSAADATAESAPDRQRRRRAAGTEAGRRAVVDAEEATDCSPRYHSGEASGEGGSPPAAADVVDWTGDDVGYFSLPGRRPDNAGRHRCRSWNLHPNCAAAAAGVGDDDDGAGESAVISGCCWAGSLSPGLPSGAGSQHSLHGQVSPTVAGSVSQDQQRQISLEQPHDHVEASCSPPPSTDGQSCNIVYIKRM